MTRPLRLADVRVDNRNHIRTALLWAYRREPGRYYLPPIPSLWRTVLRTLQRSRTPINAPTPP